MAFLPLPPSMSPMASPMPGDTDLTPSQSVSPSLPFLGMGGGAFPTGASPMEGGPMGGPNPLSQIDEAQRIVIDIARQFPGSEQFVQQIVEGMNGLRQMLAVSMSPPAQMMGGAGMMI